MMKILVDTNVALDYMLHGPDYANAMIVYLLAEKNILCGYISASAVTPERFIEAISGRSSVSGSFPDTTRKAR